MREKPYQLPTFDDVYKAVSGIAGLSVRTIRQDLKDLGIEHVGRKQRPQLYPADTAARILAARGHTLNGKAR
jgi:hypothetical protein